MPFLHHTLDMAKLWEYLTPSLARSKWRKKQNRRLGGAVSAGESHHMVCAFNMCVCIINLYFKPVLHLYVLFSLVLKTKFVVRFSFPQHDILYIVIHRTRRWWSVNHHHWQRKSAWHNVELCIGQESWRLAWHSIWSTARRSTTLPSSETSWEVDGYY